MASTDLDKLRSEVLKPSSPPSQLTGAAQYLLQRNKLPIERMIQSGVIEEESLMDAIANWETALAEDETFPILFIGLVLTLDCSFDPIRCLYCNQFRLRQKMRLDDWKVVVEEV
ncbi:MAG: hypothetical protein NZ805_01495 [Armatimonadetes bacterium]|nr:hypothetical protein [Armatimonadota bacterium]MDW8027589.1 hypothetical protein [Armatimonadota bacterium]